VYTIEGRSRMADDEQTEEREDKPQGDGPDPAARAKEKADAWDKAHEKMEEMEKQDELPSDLSEWPDDEAKYVTFGGGEGDHGYDEGPETKLGPSSLERHEDGSITIEGEEVDNPDEYKSDDPIEGASQVADDGDGGGDDKSDADDDKSDDSDADDGSRE
jgi:hypothetical protein